MNTNCEIKKKITRDITGFSTIALILEIISAIFVIFSCYTLDIVVTHILSFVVPIIGISLSCASIRYGFHSYDRAVGAMITGIVVLAISIIKAAVALATYLAPLVK